VVLQAMEQLHLGATAVLVPQYNLPQLFSILFRKKGLKIDRK